MYKLFFLIIIFIIISCQASSKFTRSGEKFPALPKNATIKVFQKENPAAGYKVIGMLTVIHDKKKIRIKTAKEIARENGANGVIPGDIKSNKPGTKIRRTVDFKSPGGFRSQISPDKVTKQEFILIRLK